MKSKITLAGLAVLASACGGANYSDPVLTSQATSTETATTTTAPLATTNTDDDRPEATTIDGYVSNAFDVTVNDVRYSDSEDFYSQEIERLQAAAIESGYADWNLKFDAQVGLTDLKYGLTVFVASVNQRGFAGQASVASDGSFRIAIPEAARDQSYNLRALKKINILLTPPAGSQEEKIKWCYNFSADASNVAVDGEPIVLNKFSTKLTRYACNIDAGGLTIPNKR